jgi:biotin-(acetyl-CoA carboxylase) ligase
MQKPWAKILKAKIDAVHATAAFKSFEKHQMAYATSAQSKDLRAEWKKFWNTVGKNVKVEDIPKDIAQYNMVRGFERFMSVCDSLLHGEYTKAYQK